MGRAHRDVAERKQLGLLEPGKEALGRARAAAVVRPLRHGAHGARRAIAVEDLEPEPRGREVGLHLLERQRRVAPQHALGGAVTGQRTADEVVGARVADVLGDRGIDVAQINEAGRQRGGEGAGRRGDHGSKQTEPPGALAAPAARNAHGRSAAPAGTVTAAGRSRAFAGAAGRAIRAGFDGRRSRQKRSTASTTAALMTTWCSGVPISNSSSRLMIEPASSKTAGMCGYLSTTS